MTCDVAVLNRSGVALATDSAVSSYRHDGSGETLTRVFRGSRKLFGLRPDLPVGILLHGRTNLMNRPWESLIGTFRPTLPARGFPTLADYARAFFRHVESHTGLFPSALQRQDFLLTCEAYVKQGLLSRLQEERGEAGADDPEAACQAFGPILGRDLEEWQGVPELEDFGEPYGEEVWRRYGREVQKSWPGILGFRPSRTLATGLARLARHLYSRQWIHPADISGIVFAGFGEKDFFPSIIDYEAGTLAADRLRVIAGTRKAIDDTEDALICPFGQVEAIHAFCSGITPELLENIKQAIHHAWPGVEGQNLLATFHETIGQTQIAPLLRMVAAMPRPELARLAGTLVHLTAFRAHLSSTEETVCGPVDVALLGRESAFTWVRRSPPDDACPDFHPTTDRRLS